MCVTEEGRGHLIGIPLCEAGDINQWDASTFIRLRWWSSCTCRTGVYAPSLSFFHLFPLLFSFSLCLIFPCAPQSVRIALYKRTRTLPAGAVSQKLLPAKSNKGTYTVHFTASSSHLSPLCSHLPLPVPEFQHPAGGETENVSNYDTACPNSAN